VGIIIDPLPNITDQVPVPTIGMFPFSEDDDEQRVESFPAFGAVIKGLVVITTVSDDGGQLPFEIVHTKVFTPTLIPITSDEGEEGVVITPLPDKSVQTPVPTIGVFPFKNEVEEQLIKSIPAFAIVGGWDV
jgi:hypothetical protein